MKPPHGKAEALRPHKGPSRRPAVGGNSGGNDGSGGLYTYRGLTLFLEDFEACIKLKQDRGFNPDIVRAQLLDEIDMTDKRYLELKARVEPLSKKEARLAVPMFRKWNPSLKREVEEYDMPKGFTPQVVGGSDAPPPRSTSVPTLG